MDSGEVIRATNGTEDTQEDKVTTTDMRIKTQTCMLLQRLLSLELLESVWYVSIIKKHKP